MSKVARFISAKCDRCGKVQGSKHQEADLYTLPHEWGEPLADQYAVCQKCLDKYSRDEWLAWDREQALREHQDAVGRHKGAVAGQGGDTRKERVKSSGGYQALRRAYHSGDVRMAGGANV